MSFLCPSIPRSLVFTALLLLSRLTAEAHAKTSKHSIAANGFTESCGFNLGGFVYNLCPLIDARVSAPDIGRAMFGDDLEGGPSSGRRVFSLDIGAGNGRSPEQSLVNQEVFAVEGL
ncbi:hypothetical protein HYPSUDRAFT_40959 [Hypholoma sublateritium FD-334 SS-4]|uniref:Uncharacterized protein n=1 Tax=Hypholoma sublateritium (strain FD-334 SS-4) TaxID=945553 RepID=A0A0D2MG28_HYPSF|nr:hypothetical protein HYPSUDRAFT_40959 [Hypholoma sublateritium FD-334 SS-4]